MIIYYLLLLIVLMIVSNINNNSHPCQAGGLGGVDVAGEAQYIYKHDRARSRDVTRRSASTNRKVAQPHFANI